MNKENTRFLNNRFSISPKNQYYILFLGIFAITVINIVNTQNLSNNKFEKDCDLNLFSVNLVLKLLL
jgi:hypothetical protein